MTSDRASAAWGASDTRTRRRARAGDAEHHAEGRADGEFPASPETSPRPSRASSRRRTRCGAHGAVFRTAVGGADRMQPRAEDYRRRAYRAGRPTVPVDPGPWLAGRRQARALSPRAAWSPEAQTRGCTRPIRYGPNPAPLGTTNRSPDVACPVPCREVR